MTSLDLILEEKIIPRIDFIKMDIEGAEILAVKGAKDIIKKYKPKISIAAYHAYGNANLIWDLLLECRPD